MKVKQLKRKIILILLIISILVPYIPVFTPTIQAVVNHSGEIEISSIVDIINNKITFKVEKIPNYDSVDRRILQWQYSSDGGITWQNYGNEVIWMDSTREVRLTIDAIKEKKGYKYRCIMNSQVNNLEAIYRDSYRAFLHRDPEPEGYKDWTTIYADEELKNEKKNHFLSNYLNGSDIINDIEYVAINQVISKEYVMKISDELDFYFKYIDNKYVKSDDGYIVPKEEEENIPNHGKQLIRDAYKFFLDREASDEEINNQYNSTYSPNMYDTWQVSFGRPGTDEHYIGYINRGILAILENIAYSQECKDSMISRYNFNGNTVSLTNGTKVMCKSISNVITIPVHTVTLNTTAGIDNVSGAGDYIEGEQVTIQATPKTGYNFNKWTGDYNETQNPYSFTMPNRDVQITANATRNVKFTLTINPNRGIYNGTDQTTEIELEKGATSTIGTPTREGYQFTGWLVSAPGGNFNSDTNIFTMGNMNATLTAQWQPNTYQVEYWGNGGNLEGTTNTGIIRNRTYGNEYRIEANPFYRIGYTFTGWNTERNGTGTSYAIGTNINTLTQKLVLYAQWTPNTYKVTYNPNGGTGSNKEENRQYGIAYNIKGNSWARYEKTGYYHNGWNTKSDGTGTHYNVGDNISSLTSDLTLYAKWNPITYTINYDSNKPSRASTSISGNTQSSTHTYDVSKNLTSNGYTLPGYIFQGWNTKADGTGTNYSNEQSVTNLTTVNGATITLYARWTPITYTVEYDRNQSTTGHWNIGTGGTTNPTYHTFDVPSNLATNGFTKNAYRYTGMWNTVWNGTGTNYSNEQSVTNLTTVNGATIRLYAQWQLITKNISGQVIWEDFNNTYGLRPENVQVTLNNDTDTVEKVKGADVNPLTVTARANSNNYQFTNTQSKKESNNSDYTYWVNQNDIRYYTTTIDGFNITNKLNTYEIQGKAFLDSLGGNNQYDIGEELTRIQVTLYDEYNNQIAITLSQSDGSYKFKNLSPAKKYKVKFTYNGLLFENVNYNTTGVNTSKVRENKRNQFNDQFKEIGSYPNNYQTTDWNTGAKITNEIYPQEEIVALFKEITEEIARQSGNEKQACQNIITKHGSTDEIKKKVQFVKDLRIDAYTDLLNPDSLTLVDGKYVSSNINCGIKARKTLDLTINTDIYNVEVQINRKTEQYTYNKRSGYTKGITETAYKTNIRKAYLEGTTFVNANKTRKIEEDVYNLYLRPEEITNGKLEERILRRQYI